MSESGSESPADKEYAVRLGAHLRQVRKQRGLSLQDVERMTGGAFKASVLGAYERGDRSISIPRLAGLAECYGVTLEELLPPEEETPVPPPATFPGRGGVTIDIAALESSLDSDAQIIERYINRIRLERGSSEERTITIRRDDIRVIGAFLDMAEEDLLRRLQELAVVALGGEAGSESGRIGGGLERDAESTPANSGL